MSAARADSTRPGPDLDQQVRVRRHLGHRRGEQDRLANLADQQLPQVGVGRQGVSR